MKNKRIILNWTLLIIWMVFIFLMSNQPGEISSKQSDFVVKIFNFIGLDLNSYFGNIATFIVRKAAHFTEYFILYILTVRVMKEYYSNKIARNISLAVVLGYAITDEIHQYFVPGRAMALKDVAIDFSGGLVAFITESTFYKIKNKKMKKSIN